MGRKRYLHVANRKWCCPPILKTRVNFAATRIPCISATRLGECGARTSPRCILGVLTEPAITIRCVNARDSGPLEQILAIANYLLSLDRIQFFSLSLSLERGIITMICVLTWFLRAAFVMVHTSANSREVIMDDVVGGHVHYVAVNMSRQIVPHRKPYVV